MGRNWENVGLFWFKVCWITQTTNHNKLVSGWNCFDFVWVRDLELVVSLLLPLLYFLSKFDGWGGGGDNIPPNKLPPGQCSHLQV